LTLADYTVSFTCIHDTTPLVYEPDRPEQQEAGGFTR